VVEQLTRNPETNGSNPASGIMREKFGGFRFKRLFFKNIFTTNILITV
jgi:hypothetical protein